MRISAVAFVASAFLVHPGAAAQSWTPVQTLDLASPETAGTFLAADVVQWTPDTCTHEVLWAAGPLGVPSIGNVDAISNGGDVFPTIGPYLDLPSERLVIAYYSVDRNTIGLGGNPVALEAADDGAASDVFGLDLTNAAYAPWLSCDHCCLTPKPNESDIDGVSWTAGDYPVYFSVDPATADTMGVSPADVLMVSAPFVPPIELIGEAELGLVPGDDIDALAMGPEGLAFSLTASSPSAWATSDVGPAGLYRPGLLPWTSALQMGLLETDDLNAVMLGDPDQQHCEPYDEAAITHMCGAFPFDTDETSVWRVFDLSDKGPGYRVDRVRVGGRTVASAFDVDVRLWSSSSDDPSDPMELVATSAMTYGDAFLGFVDHPFDAVDAGREFLWVEMRIHNGLVGGAFMWLGSRCEVAPTYISSPDAGCGWWPPLDLDLVPHDLGVVMTVIGHNVPEAHILAGAAKRGEEAHVVFAGASPGATVHFLFSFAGSGAGVCPPELGGTCIDLLAPVRRRTAIADDNGVASAMLTIPPAAPLTELFVQGATEPSPGETAFVKTAVTSAEIQP